MKRALACLSLGLLLVTLTSCYPYGVPPGHAKRYGYHPGWNSPAGHHPNWYNPASSHGIKPKYKSTHYASKHHHH
ncbi:hypothetical protein [Prosthecobacter sp.]|uniref:hypothetical protein n=1 Tax=Prosthecobacter sp. TaxID=1965333 RepID=UPI001D77CC21|nr:hypothetical protein [Prosthecobacter sp.]MCB1279737.1 hypothetical protein [Prosthecobacter sp.]